MTNICTQKELLTIQRQLKLDEWNKKFPNGCFTVQNWNGDHWRKNKGNVVGKCYLGLYYNKRPRTSHCSYYGVIVMCSKNEESDIKLYRTFTQNNSWGLCKHFKCLEDMTEYTKKENFPPQMIELFIKSLDDYKKDSKQYFENLAKEINTKKTT